MTANDYANIQRMIDEEGDGLAEAIEDIARDLRREFEQHIADLQHQINRLINSLEEQ